MLHMGNPEHIKTLKLGVEAWNRWRMENRTVEPDLSDAVLAGDNLSGANLCGTNFRRANLIGASSGKQMRGMPISARQDLLLRIFAMLI